MSAETLRKWIRWAEVDQGQAPGVPYTAQALLPVSDPGYPGVWDIVAGKAGALAASAGDDATQPEVMLCTGYFRHVSS